MDKETIEQIEMQLDIKEDNIEIAHYQQLLKYCYEENKRFTRVLSSIMHGTDGASCQFCDDNYERADIALKEKWEEIK